MTSVAGEAIASVGASARRCGPGGSAETSAQQEGFARIVEEMEEKSADREAKEDERATGAGAVAATPLFLASAPPGLAASPPACIGEDRESARWADGIESTSLTVRQTVPAPARLNRGASIKELVGPMAACSDKFACVRDALVADLQEGEWAPRPGNQEDDAPESLAQIGSKATNIKIDVNSIQTHLPPVIAKALAVTTADAHFATMKSDPGALPLRFGSEPLRVLKFSLEPASLGAISVQMRVTQGRIEITIDTEHEATTALLIDAQHDLIAAIGKHGFNVDSLAVTAHSVQPSATEGRGDATFDDANSGDSGESGFASEDQSGGKDRQENPSAETPERQERAASPRPGGVIL